MVVPRHVRIAEQLKAFFSKFGSVESVQVMYNRETRKSRGFGFVIFDSTASVDLVLQQRMHTINEKQVRHGHGGGKASASGHNRCEQLS